MNRSLLLTVSFVVMAAVLFAASTSLRTARGATVTPGSVSARAVQSDESDDPQPPEVSVSCLPHIALPAQQIVCNSKGDLHDASGTFEWVALGGDPPGATDARLFATAFGSPGAYDISLNVCNSNACTKVSATIRVGLTADDEPAGPSTTNEADMALVFVRTAFTCPTVPAFNSQFHLISAIANVRMTEVGSGTLTLGSIDGGHLVLSNAISGFDLTIIGTAVGGSYWVQEGACHADYSVDGTITPGFTGG